MKATKKVTIRKVQGEVNPLHLAGGFYIIAAVLFGCCCGGAF